MLSDQEARAKVNGHKWFHAFELRPGLVTPGLMPTNAHDALTNRYGLGARLDSLRALDIGALDGPYAFELERRGAEVTALDIQSPDVSGFNIAREVLGSKVQYVQGNVYDLTTLLSGRKFDIITFFGVWYHLKNPVRAFEQIRSLLADDSLLLFEGEFLHHYMEAPGRSPEELRSEARSLAASLAPICLFYGNGYRNDVTNWCVPNIACVNQWLNAAAMQMERHSIWAEWPNQRLAGRARPIPGKSVLVDNPVW